MIAAYLRSFPDVIASWPLKKRAMFLFFSGALCVPALPPACLWPLLGLGLPLFYAFLSTTRSARTAFAEGWLFAFGYFGFGLAWIGNALLVEGNAFSWVWPLAIAGLPALLSLFYGICGVMLHILVKLRSWSGWYAFIGAIALTEWVRGHIFTGFPWNLYGYTWNESLSLAQSAALFGSYGLTFLTIILAMVPALWWCDIGRKKVRLLTSLCISVIVLGLFLWGHARLAAHPLNLRSDITVRIVQPNIPQEDKWDGRKAGENIKKTLELSLPDDGNSTAPTIIIWPETAVTERLLMNSQVSEATKSVLQNYRHPAYLITGILRSDLSPEGQERYYNSLATYDKNLNRVSLYDKSHLVPFGEYIPYGQYIPLKPFVEFSGFEQGDGPETQPLDTLMTISPLVCYEIIFPGAVTNPRQNRSDLIVNVTNDGWYGDSGGPRQHLAMARFRAIEEGIPVARSANTGISGMFDAYGRAVTLIPLNQTKAVNVALPQALGKTVYNKSNDLIFFIFVISSFLVSCLCKRRSA